ncbi:MAG: ribosome silencing factor [Lentimicrobiaceae bacterium]|jgi:ribosome-associated protein|nr:ribosome silencing factor [Lentimicrobiaceae bacterium]
MRRRKQSENTESILNTIIETIKETKGKEIVSMDMQSTISAITDHFVICHGTSKTQVDAIAHKIIENVKKEHHQNPYNKEGFENSEWILIDYVDIVVHIFLAPIRSFYQLEELWADAETTKHEYDV